MKVNHYQFKNAVAHLSNHKQQQFPNNQYFLAGAVFRIKQQAWELSAYPRIPDDVIIDITRLPPPLVAISEIGSDESISLDNIFIETMGVGKAIDTAAIFINHADKISSVSLWQLVNESTRAEIKWKLFYWGVDNNNEDIFLDILVNPQTETPLLIELDYPRHKKAIEIAEDFIKQSTEILNAGKGLHMYEGEGIHEMYYKGVDLAGEAIKLVLRIDSSNGIIISSKILPLDEKPT